MTFKLGMLALVAGLIAAPAFAADYQTNLGPMPLDDETKAVIGGRGEATATTDGNTLTVKGTFRDMPSNATKSSTLIRPLAGKTGAFKYT